MHIQSRDDYDAVVVGSGITGGWAAKELTEKGLSTIVLERGRRVEHGEDYVTEHLPAYDMYYRGRGDRVENEEKYPIQSRGGGFSEYTKQWYVDDRKDPYVDDEENPFMWIRGYQLGGRSINWGRQCYRWSNLDFEANARDGYGVDWPIRYEDIAPWYDYVEGFAGISGKKEGLSQLPDGNFLPPMPMNCAEQSMKEAVERHFDRTMTPGRTAILTEDHNGRAACHYCGPCARGCSTGSYFCSLSTTLPAARQTGNLTISCDSIVHSVIYDPELDRATGVRVIDRKSKETREVYGRLIFLCASTLGSTKILLNSTSPRFPDGLANSSGVLGHYLMDHCFKSGATGEMPGHEDAYYYGNRPNGIYIPRFRNLDGQDADADFLRGYGYQGGASRPSWNRGTSKSGFGADLKHSLREPGPWSMWIGGWGECLPRSENYVELDSEVEDAWGMPALRIHASWSDNEDNMREDMRVQALEMLEAAGAKDIETFLEFSPPGLCIHEMGTARMGRDPQTSVLNAYNQAHDVDNLFVTDGSAMASSACQNPSITYMALTARACDYAVEEMKRGNI
jgi:choline dehydrogenase-like flavoprotein